MFRWFRWHRAKRSLAGLEVDECFSLNSYRPRKLPAARQFYVLKRPRA